MQCPTSVYHMWKLTYGPQFCVCLCSCFSTAIPQCLYSRLTHLSPRMCLNLRKFKFSVVWIHFSNLFSCWGSKDLKKRKETIKTARQLLYPSVKLMVFLIVKRVVFLIMMIIHSYGKTQKLAFDLDRQLVQLIYQCLYWLKPQLRSFRQKSSQLYLEISRVETETLYMQSLCSIVELQLHPKRNRTFARTLIQRAIQAGSTCLAILLMVLSEQQFYVHAWQNASAIGRERKNWY